MQKKWVFKDLPQDPEVNDLSAALNIDRNLAAILIQRGIDDFQKAKEFFRPSLQQLHDPFLMKDMEEAVTCVLEAMAQNHKILVYGDYDVDGTTAVALVYSFLRSQHQQVDFYVPDRYTEGYGLSAKALDWAVEHEYKLIITLDCGIKAVDLVAQGVAQGLDFIICDHHLPGAQLPAAKAILDPKREDCSYPFDDLSGCGVGFKLVQALCHKLNIPIEVTYDYLDLVAVSIAADLVPILGENRTMAYYGLRILNKKPRPGLGALIEVSGLKGKVGITEIVFGIAPRINAAGRIEHANSAVQLLLARKLKEAEPWAHKVNERNSTRKTVDTNITREAIQMIEQAEDSTDSKSTVLYKEDWHKGVIGIVASRCIEKYYRPTIILTESQDKATGSARSVEGFDIYEAIAACSDLLDAYGGHKYAAGLTMPLEKIPQFQRRFEEVVSTTITEEMLTPVLEIDMCLEVDDIDRKFYNVLRQLAPFGPGNRTPVLVSKNLTAHSEARVLKDEHLKFRIKSSKGRYFVGVAFGLARYADKINAGTPFDLAYTLEVNEYRGEKSLQMMVKDIKLKQ